MNKKSSIIVSFLFAVIVLSGRATTNDERNTEGRKGIAVSVAEQIEDKVVRMREMVADMKADHGVIQKKATEERVKVKQFIEFILGHLHNGSIAFDMTQIPTDREPTLDDLLLAMGSAPEQIS